MPPSSYKTLLANKWPFPPSEQSIPELFIVESMDEKDEEAGHFEGVRIAQILRLAKRKPKYFYVQDERELDLVVPVFRQSNYRYLHLSCHGDKDGFFLRDGNLSFKRFAEIFDTSLQLRRLFVSACEAGQEKLAHALHRTARGIQSVTAPRGKIDYDHAAAIWSAFYLSLLQKGDTCRHPDVKSRIASLVKLFPMANKEDEIPMSFMFAGYDSTKDKGDLNPKAWGFETISKDYKPPGARTRKSAKRAKGK